MSIQRRVAITAAGVMVLAGVGISVKIATAAGGGPTMQTVSSDRLAQEGMYLVEASRTPVHNQSEAVQSALVQFPGATIRETTLADVHDSNVPAVNGKTAWIMSLRPALGIHPPSRGPAGNPAPALGGQFMLLFIDSQTGSFIFGDMGT